MKYKFKVRTSYVISKTPQGNYFVNIGGTVNVYSSIDGKKVISFKELKHPSTLCFNRDGSILAVKNTSGKIAVYDMHRLICIGTYVPTKHHGANILFTPDDKYIVSADYEGHIYMIDLENQKSKIIRDTGLMIVFIEYIEEDNLYIFQHGNSYALWKYPFDKHELQIINSEKERGLRIYCSANQLYLANYRYKSNIDIYDKNENLIKTIYFDTQVKSNTIVQWSASWSSDGKYIAFICRIMENDIYDKDVVKVLRYSDLRVMKEYELEYAHFTQFTKDGKEFLIGTWNNGYVIDMDDVLDGEPRVAGFNTSDSETGENGKEEPSIEDQYNALLDRIRNASDTDHITFDQAVSNLTYQEKVLFYVWEFGTLLENDGLSCYALSYSNEYIENLIPYLANIDLKEHAKMVKKALKLYMTDGNNEYNQNWKKIDEDAANLDENIEYALEKYLNEN